MQVDYFKSEIVLTQENYTKLLQRFGTKLISKLHSPFHLNAGNTAHSFLASIYVIVDKQNRPEAWIRQPIREESKWRKKTIPICCHICVYMDNTCSSGTTETGRMNSAVDKWERGELAYTSRSDDIVVDVPKHSPHGMPTTIHLYTKR